jgi:predicted ester cyclase
VRARELYAEDFVVHVNALDFHGQEGIAKSVALYRAVFPDLRIVVEDQTADGDRVTSRWTLHGNHKGRAVTLPGITISRVENGRIAEDWTVSDNLELLRRLGPRRGLALACGTSPDGSRAPHGRDRRLGRRGCPRRPCPVLSS